MLQELRKGANIAQEKEQKEEKEETTFAKDSSVTHHGQRMDTFAKDARTLDMRNMCYALDTGSALQTKTLFYAQQRFTRSIVEAYIPDLHLEDIFRGDKSINRGPENIPEKL